MAPVVGNRPFSFFVIWKLYKMEIKKVIFLKILKKCLIFNLNLLEIRPSFTRIAIHSDRNFDWGAQTFAQPLAMTGRQSWRQLTMWQVSNYPAVLPDVKPIMSNKHWRQTWDNSWGSKQTKLWFCFRKLGPYFDGFHNNWVFRNKRGGWDIHHTQPNSTHSVKGSPTATKQYTFCQEVTNGNQTVHILSRSH